MRVEELAASSLVACLACFLIVNLHNILRVHLRRGFVKTYAEMERPAGPIVGLAALGTGVYFVEALVYPLVVFSNLLHLLYSFPFLALSSLFSYIQFLGILVTVSGYLLFIWSVVVRGRYAVSWGMPENHKLVTWGPYQYVRHPSYLGYFLMFLGLFFIWPNPFTLFPLVAVPGYYRITFHEEELLKRRFGDAYLEYSRKSGRFIPRFR